MEIEYTTHAFERLAGRGISKRAIREAIVHAQRREVEFEGEIKVSYTKNNITLVVVYALLGHQKYLIITSYYGN